MAPTPHTRVIDVEPGPLLGIGSTPGTDYPVTTTPLPTGSLLALYTDGLVETPHTDITEAIDALAQHLTTASSRPISDLADDLLRYAVPRHTHTDDIALLLLRNR